MTDRHCKNQENTNEAKNGSNNQTEQFSVVNGMRDER